MLSTARAVSDAIFSTRAREAPAERLDWLVQQFDRFLVSAGPRPVFLFRLMLALISLLAPLTVGRLPGIARLPLSLRAQAIDRLEHGFASQLVLGVKALLCLLYYEHPDAAREAGYIGQGAVHLEARPAPVPEVVT